MKIPSPSTRHRARLEIIPLIDVVFFLLATFVMVSLSMVKNQGIPVRLPGAATSTAQERASAVTITLAADGALYLNRQAVSPDELTRRLTELKAAESNMRVFINGDQQASFGRAIDVLDRVRRLGIAHVAVQTATPSP